MLMRQTIKTVSELAAISGDLEFSVFFPDFLHERTMQGDLSCGSVNDFRNAAGNNAMLAVISAGNKPSQLVEAVKNELNDSSENSQLSVAISLAGHSSVEAGALRKRDWNDMIRALKFFTGKSLQYSSFDGVVIGPLSNLELLLSEME
jgi:hypothetical protein